MGGSRVITCVFVYPSLYPSRVLYHPESEARWMI